MLLHKTKNSYTCFVSFSFFLYLSPFLKVSKRQKEWNSVCYSCDALEHVNIKNIPMLMDSCWWWWCQKQSRAHKNIVLARKQISHKIIIAFLVLTDKYNILMTDDKYPLLVKRLRCHIYVYVCIMDCKTIKT